MKKLIALAVLLSSSTFAQFVQNFGLQANIPPPAANVQAFVSGTAGAATACYWVVTRYIGGAVLVGQPTCLSNAPNTLNGSNFVVINWSPAIGTSILYDVLKTATIAPPVPGASTALSTGLSVTTVNDQGGALSGYTLAGYPNQNVTTPIRLNNRDYVTPTIEFLGSFPVNFFGGYQVNSGSVVSTTNYTDSFAVLIGADCSLNATTGAFTAAGTTTGTNPGPIRIAAGNWVFQGVTTAAANALTLDCDLDPPTRTTIPKGALMTGVQIFYGVQTTALTSITAPVLNSITYPATGGAAAATVASAGGTLAITPATLQLATTTSGQCYSENITFGTAIPFNNPLQRFTVEQVFNQTGAAATQLQICGLAVLYSYTN